MIAQVDADDGRLYLVTIQLKQVPDKVSKVFGIQLAEPIRYGFQEETARIRRRKGHVWQKNNNFGAR